GSSDSLPQLEEKLIIDETIIKTPENPEPLKDLNKESKDNIDQIEMIESQNLSDQLSIYNQPQTTLPLLQQDNDLPQDAPFGLAASKGNVMSQLNIEIVSGTLLRRKRNQNTFFKK
ncbi:MAG: hypothetical protein EZS28_033819, partial [Streblomastix strix]